MGSRLLAAGLVAGILALPLVVALAPIESGDPWWHLAVGHRVLDSGSLVTAEPFSHTAAGEPFTPQEWLSQVCLAAADRLFGLGGVRALTALLLLAGGLLIWLRARLGGLDRPRAALVVASVAPALCLLVEPRPHMFSFVFLGAFACLGLRSRAPSWRAVAGGALLTAVWANFHAVAVLAPLLAGAAWVESVLGRRDPQQQPRRRLAFAVAVAAGVLLNPSGPALYAYAFSNAGLAAMVIDEWQPFWFGDAHVPAAGLPIWAGAAVALGLGLFAVLRRIAQRHPEGAVQLAGTGYLLLSARRWLWLGWLPAFHGLRAMPPFRGRGAAVSTAAAALALLPLLNPRVQQDLRPAAWARGHAATASAPVAAADFLAALGQGGSLYHPYHWGGFLLYRLQPAWKVFIYGETAVFMKAGVIEERQRVETGPPAEGAAILERRGVAALVLPRVGRDGRPTAPPGGDGPGGAWIRAFASPREVVWLRRGERDLVNAAAARYRGLGIEWDPQWGFLEHRALLGNPEWCRQVQLLAGDSLEDALEVAGRVRSRPGDDAARQAFLQGLRSARLQRSAGVFEASGR